MGSIQSRCQFCCCYCDSMVQVLQIFNSFSIHNLPYITPKEEVNRGSVRILWGHGMRPSLPIHLTACHTYSIAYTEVQNMNDKQCHSAVDACVLHRTAQYINIWHVLSFVVTISNVPYCLSHTTCRLQTQMLNLRHIYMKCTKTVLLVWILYSSVPLSLVVL